jgi:hypothetical protein
MKCNNCYRSTPYKTKIEGRPANLAYPNTTYYTVQTLADVVRLQRPQDDWPAQDIRATVGAGLYCWSDWESALCYADLLEQVPDDLYVLPLIIAEVEVSFFPTIDLRQLQDEAVSEWLRRHHRMENGYEHGAHHVIRSQGCGDEHYFAVDVYPIFLPLAPIFLPRKFSPKATDL